MENSKFHEAVHAVFTTSKFLGVFPFQGRSLVSKLLNRIPLSMLTLCLAWEGYNWYVTPGVSPWLASNTGWYFKLVSLPPFCYAMLHQIYRFSRAGHIAGVFAQLEEIEASLERLSPVKYVHAGRQRKVLVFMIIVKVLNVCGIRNCWSFNWSFVRAFNLLTLVFGRVSMVVVGVQFSTILQTMRDQLRTMITIVQSGSNRIGHPVSTRDIENLLKIYNQICSVCQIVNSSYSNQLLGTVTMDYININTNAYRIVTYFSLFFFEEEHLSIFWLLVRFMGFAQSIIVLLLIADDFNKALYRQAISEVNPELQYSDILCAHLSVGRTPVFTACGLFYLDFEMIYSVCGSTVTFIVLALQMF